MASALISLPDEQLQRVLSFLRAIDLCSVVETCARLGLSAEAGADAAAGGTRGVIEVGMASGLKCNEIVQQVMREQVACLYTVNTPRRLSEDLTDMNTLYQLHVVETKFLMSLISLAEPKTGYWISKSWVSNARKHWEGQLVDKSKLSRKKARIRERRDSEVLPPWPDINAEITCVHGNLASCKNARSKRRVIDKRSWTTLCRFFPMSHSFKTSGQECKKCRTDFELAKIEQDERIAATRQTRLQHLTSTCANDVCSRKNGIPSQCQQPQSSPAAICPLLPGLYHLVPRDWLCAWRRFFKDPRSADPGMLDCTGLLCEAHGLLSIPAHVQEYMCGLRRNLLSHARDGGGTLCEIVTTEEWDAILTQERQCDFSVRFMVDVDGGVQWNVEPCLRCDNTSASFHDVSVRPRQRAWVQV